MNRRTWLGGLLGLLSVGTIGSVSTASSQTADDANAAIATFNEQITEYGKKHNTLPEVTISWDLRDALIKHFIEQKRFLDADARGRIQGYTYLGNRWLTPSNDLPGYNFKLS